METRRLFPFHHVFSGRIPWSRVGYKIFIPGFHHNSPENGWFPIGISVSSGLFSGDMLVSGSVPSRQYPSICHLSGGKSESRIIDSKVPFLAAHILVFHEGITTIFSRFFPNTHPKFNIAPWNMMFGRWNFFLEMVPFWETFCSFSVVRVTIFSIICSVWCQKLSSQQAPFGTWMSQEVSKWLVNGL